MASGDSESSSDESKYEPQKSTNTPISPHNETESTQKESTNDVSEGVISQEKTGQSKAHAETNTIINDNAPENATPSSSQEELHSITSSSPQGIEQPSTNSAGHEASEESSPHAEDDLDPTADQSIENPHNSHIRSIWQSRMNKLSQTPKEESTDDEGEEVDYEPPIETLKVLDPVIPRKVWGAMDPTQPPTPRDGDISRMMCVATKTDPCFSGKDCTRVIQEHQKELIVEKKQADLPYNFLVGGDGRIYEGLGWKAKCIYPDQMPDEYNDGRVFSIGFVGQYGEPSCEEKPTEHMIHARRLLTRYGVENDYIGRGLEVMTLILGKI